MLQGQHRRVCYHALEGDETKMSTRVAALLFLVLTLLVPVRPRADDSGKCKERCEEQRKKMARKLEECLRDVDPDPRDRAAKMRLLCRKRYTPPRCDGLPSCKELEQQKKKEKGPEPGMRLGPMVFSDKRRGPPVERPRYPAGGEIFLRIDVEVTPKPRAARIFLDLSLRLLAKAKDAKSPPREVVRWDSYAQEQRPIAPAERGLTQRFTLHGGAKLPPNQAPGRYELEARVREKGSEFEGMVGGSFAVTRGR
jgi:hypothetical protein